MLHDCSYAEEPVWLCNVWLVIIASICLLLSTVCLRLASLFITLRVCSAFCTCIKFTHTESEKNYSFTQRLLTFMGENKRMTKHQGTFGSRSYHYIQYTLGPGTITFFYVISFNMTRNKSVPSDVAAGAWCYHLTLEPVTIEPLGFKRQDSPFKSIPMSQTKNVSGFKRRNFYLTQIHTVHQIHHAGLSRKKNFYLEKEKRKKKWICSITHCLNLHDYYLEGNSYIVEVLFVHLLYGI